MVNGINCMGILICALPVFAAWITIILNAVAINAESIFLRKCLCKFNPKYWASWAQFT